MKWYNILLVLVFALVITGCSKTSTPVAKSYIGGTDGVQANFDTDAPPNEVNFGDEFNTVVVLQNNGEYTVPAGEYFVRLMGFSPSDFGTSNDALVVYPDEDLQGNELNVDTGETFESYPVYVTIPQNDMLKYSGPTSGKKLFPFTLEACYRYQTKALGDLCIKKDLSKASDNKVCMISSQRTISTSSAPVQISDLKEYGAGSEKVRFTFMIVAANAGGEVSLASMGDTTCSDQTTDKGVVYLTVDSGIDGLSCSGFLEGKTESGSMVEGFIKIGSSGSRQISCTQEIADGDRFNGVKPVTISAEYDYLQSLEKDVTIKQYE